MGKSTISMAIITCYVCLPEGINWFNRHWLPQSDWDSQFFSVIGHLSGSLPRVPGHPGHPAICCWSRELHNRRRKNPRMHLFLGACHVWWPLALDELSSIKINQIQLSRQLLLWCTSQYNSSKNFWGVGWVNSPCTPGFRPSPTEYVQNQQTVMPAPLTWF